MSSEDSGLTIDPDRFTGEANETDRDEHTAVLSARAELLSARNERLRTALETARRTRYRQTAIGMAVIGTGALVAGVVFPNTREILFALGGTGLFGAVLTYYLTPERFVAESVGERVFAAGATNATAIVEALELRSERIYLPPRDQYGPRLFVPRFVNPNLPVDGAGPFVPEEDQRGLVLTPTGAGLFAEFERVLSTDLAETPEGIADQLADASVESFEIARSVVPTVAEDGDHITFAVSGAAFGPVDRFDHPLASFFSVGCATALSRPIHLETERGDDRADWLVTCYLETEE